MIRALTAAVALLFCSPALPAHAATYVWDMDTSEDQVNNAGTPDGSTDSFSESVLLSDPVGCQVGRALNVVDDLSVDCDLFDDGMVNTSCPQAAWAGPV